MNCLLCFFTLLLTLIVCLSSFHLTLVLHIFSRRFFVQFVSSDYFFMFVLRIVWPRLFVYASFTHCYSLIVCSICFFFRLFDPNYLLTLVSHILLTSIVCLRLFYLHYLTSIVSLHCLTQIVFCFFSIRLFLTLFVGWHLFFSNHFTLILCLLCLFTLFDFIWLFIFCTRRLTLNLFFSFFYNFRS